ncbi:hypothetical protein B0H21DRAFT_120444 [Amylocystis lapponica]|nr:hypothetical protein B0H21DRAFT_120444 [Amylocystis lapponica]
MIGIIPACKWGHSIKIFVSLVPRSLVRKPSTPCQRQCRGMIHPMLIDNSSVNHIDECTFRPSAFRAVLQTSSTLLWARSFLSCALRQTDTACFPVPVHTMRMEESGPWLYVQVSTSTLMIRTSVMPGSQTVIQDGASCVQRGGSAYHISWVHQRNVMLARTSFRSTKEITEATYHDFISNVRSCVDRALQRPETQHAFSSSMLEKAAQKHW